MNCLQNEILHEYELCVWMAYKIFCFSFIKSVSKMVYTKWIIYKVNCLYKWSCLQNEPITIWNVYKMNC